MKSLLILAFAGMVCVLNSGCVFLENNTSSGIGNYIQYRIEDYVATKEVNKIQAQAKARAEAEAKAEAESKPMISCPPSPENPNAR